MDVSETKLLRKIERKNIKFKKIVAEQLLDPQMPKDVNSRKHQALVVHRLFVAYLRNEHEAA